MDKLLFDKAFEYLEKKDWHSFENLMQDEIRKGDRRCRGFLAAQIYTNPLYRKVYDDKDPVAEALRLALPMMKEGHVYGYYLVGVILGNEFDQIGLAYEYLSKAYVRGYLPAGEDMVRLQKKYREYLAVVRQNPVDPDLMYFTDPFAQEAYLTYLETTGVSDALLKPYKKLAAGEALFFHTVRQNDVEQLIHTFIFTGEEIKVYDTIQLMEKNIMKFFLEKHGMITRFPMIKDAEELGKYGIKNNLFDFLLSEDAKKVEGYQPFQYFWDSETLALCKAMEQTQTFQYLQKKKNSPGETESSIKQMLIRQQYAFDRSDILYRRRFFALYAYWLVYCEYYRVREGVDKSYFKQVMTQHIYPRYQMSCDIYRKERQLLMDYLHLSKEMLRLEGIDFDEQRDMAQCVADLSRDPAAGLFPIVLKEQLVGYNMQDKAAKIFNLFGKKGNPYLLWNEVIAASENIEDYTTELWILTGDTLYSDMLPDPIKLAGLQSCRVDTKGGSVPQYFILQYVNGTNKEVWISKGSDQSYYIAELLNHIAAVKGGR